MQKLDCLFIGSATKDLIMLVESPPASDQRIAATLFAITCGGVSSTAAVAHQRLGGVTGTISTIGDDDTGVYIRGELCEQGFAYLRLHEIAGVHSSTTMIQVEHSGKRCLTCFGGSIERLTFDMIDKEAVRSAKIVHLGVLNPETMLQISHYVKNHTGALLSIDSGNLSRELTDALLPYSDFFIPDNKTAMKTLGMMPADACRYYVEKGARFGCVTSGEEGIWAYDGENEYRVETISVEVLDTTGAGDNFHGAFVYCINQGWEIMRCLRFANIFASLSCEGLGGRAAIPEKQRVLSVLQNIS